MGIKKKVKAAIRPTIPAFRRNQEEASTPTKTDRWEVGRALLCEVVARHPAHLTVDQLVQRAVEDNTDMASAYYAIRDLRRTGLFHYGADEIVEPTQAALHAHALLSSND